MDIRGKTLDLLQNLREKPESTRWAIVIAVTMIIVAILVVFWGWSISREFATLSEPSKDQSKNTELLPSSFTSSLKNMADSFKAYRSGDNPEKIAEDLKEKNAEVMKPQLESPSVFWYVLQSFAGMIRYNVGAVGTAFGNIFHGRF